MKTTVLAQLAQLVCIHTNWSGDIPPWWEKLQEDLTREFLPSGSGFDAGTKVDLEASSPDRIVLTTAFHHMDEHGGYDGWSEHSVIITPSFIGVNIRVTGRDRNDIKDYIAQAVHYVLAREMHLVWNATERTFDITPIDCPSEILAG